MVGRAFALVGSRGFPSTYGGFETFVRRLAPYLAAQGDRVTVYGRGGNRGARMVSGVRCITTMGYDSNSLSTLSYGLTSTWHGRSQDFDAALVLNVANGFFLPVLRQAGIPTAVNVDGIEWERDKWSRLGKTVFRLGADLTARHATEIVVDSQEIGRIWRTRFGRDGIYIPYGADVVRKLDDAKIREKGLEAGTYALVVARLVPENNVDLFLDALERVGPSLPAVVVGGANRPSKLVERLRACDDSQRKFHWLGHVDDQDLLSQLWNHCAVYFHGHSVGGTNPALLQALGHGAPTLALDTPFNAEVIDNGEQLVSDDASVIATKLQEVAEDPVRQRRYANCGRTVVSERFAWSDVLAAYRETLHNLADAEPKTLRRKTLRRVTMKKPDQRT